MHRTGELSGQYKTLEQQRETASLGMWVFLSTEVLFFGGLFMTYTINRSTYPDIFSAASKTITLWLGAVNTVVLIASSLTMALSVWASQAGKKKLLTIFLTSTLILGCVFLGIKAIEYHDKYVEHHIPGWNFNYFGSLRNLCAAASRRTTTRPSKTSASTGTSSISSGFSCSRCSI